MRKKERKITHRCETEDGWVCIEYDGEIILQVVYYARGEKQLVETLVNYCPFCGFSMTLNDLSKSHLDEVLGL